MAISEFTRVRVGEETAPEHIIVPAVTVETSVFVALGLMALAIRLLGLDNAPLAADEALQALGSWNFVNHTPVNFTGSPFLFSANALLFMLGGAHDVSARLFPAIFGSALVLLPALFRREIGRVGAIVASVLLAISPSLVFFSRDSNGAIIAITAALAALAFGWRYLVGRLPRDLYCGAAMLAIGLLAAREIWTVLLAVGILALVRLPRIRQELSSAEVSDGPVYTQQVDQYKNHFTRAGVVFVMVFLGIATAFMLHRDGVGAAFDLFGAWLVGLTPGTGLFDPLRLLIVYSPIELFFGAAALVDLAFAARQANQNRTPLFVLGAWAVVAFILYSIGSDKNPARIVVIVVPLAHVAGWYIGSWISSFLASLEDEPNALQTVLTQETPVYLFACALAAFLYFVLAEFSTRGSVIAADLLSSILKMPSNPALNGVVLIMLIAVAFAAVTFLAITTVGWERSKSIGTAVALTLLTLWSVRETSLLNYSGPWNPREWLVARAASPNVRDLESDVEDISRWRANDSHTLIMLADNSLGPVVKWYLRDMRYVQYQDHPVMVPGIQALLLPVGAPVNQGKLMSQRYQIDLVRDPEPSPSLITWLLFRQGGGTSGSKAVLWIPQPN